MRNYIFLYREKDSDDRDCCAYIEPQPRFECGHYFGNVNPQGACYCGGNLMSYDKIETVLTESEYQTLLDYNEVIRNLGYGITEGDERYKRGMAAYKDVEYVFDKLQSPEAQAFQDKIIESEREFLKENYSLDDDDIDAIFNEYCLDYRDRSIVGYVFKDSSELGYEEAWQLGYIKNNDPISQRYFDTDKFGEDLLEEENYIELRDGRVVNLMY